MQGKSLYDFYEKFLLPQFGLVDAKIEWSESKDVGPDESVHYFSIDPTMYVLIFEDYGGLGADPNWVKENVRLKSKDFEYIYPVSYSDHAPSYPVKFPLPCRYCINVTGTFTLIKL